MPDKRILSRNPINVANTVNYTTCASANDIIKCLF